jgi:1-deoxy-D-xylulose-5-phosphate synthase
LNLFANYQWQNIYPAHCSKTTDGLKGMVSSSSNLFEALKLGYLTDGHNVAKPIETLQDLKDIPEPTLP